MTHLIAFLVTLAIALTLSFLLAWPAMWLWNAVLVEQFTSVAPISWLNMWGLMILIQMIFGTAIKAN